MPVSAPDLVARPHAPASTAAPAFASLVEFTARLLDVPFASLSLVEGRTFSTPPVASDAWSARRLAPLARTLCRLPVDTGRPVLLRDARVESAVLEEPVLWMGEVGYAGVPVRAFDGSVAGTLCAADTRAREWSEDDAETLEQLAGFAALLMDRRPPMASEAGFVGAIGTARGRLSLRMLEKAVETMQIGVTITDQDGRILYSNPAEARMHGYEVEELRGQHARIFAPPQHARPMPTEAMEEVTSWSRETVNLRKDGSSFPVLLRSDVVKDSRGRPIGLVTCCEDITSRREMERQLLRSAFFEPVTGLPNRGLFLHRLELAVERERRGDGDFAVIVVGVDRLQLVDDSLGRAAADTLLEGVALRLRECARTDTLVAHVARGEFALLLDEIDGIGEPSRMAACVQDGLAHPFPIEGHEVFTGASVGIAFSYSGYERAEDVLRDAAIALYRSRDARQGQYEVFDRDMHAEAIRRLKLESELRGAVERGEFRVHYQPIVSLGSGRIAGLEALVRWQNPQRGMLQPDEFIPLAEETGLILPIGMWVLEEACRELRAWQASAPDRAGLTMAVNLSAGQFLQPDLVDRVAGVLAASGIAPGTLKLEITESVLMAHTREVTERLARLKELGVQLHIDDFGTGYSSLGYLHRLPLDALKIDRTFVSAESGGVNLPLVRTIVALAHALGVVVVTEGIESPEVLDELRALNCEFGQGFLFSRPLSSEAMEALFASDPSW